jgi:histidine kinase
LLDLARSIISRLMHSLSFKLSFTAGLIIFLAVLAAAYLNILDQRAQAEQRVESEAQGFIDTVRRATYWSMLRNQRESLHQIIQSVADQPGIQRVRVFNKDGTVMFSSLAEEIGREVDKKAEACYGCHAQQAPLARLPSGETTRIFTDPEAGHRVLGIIKPIYNEPSCYTPACHAHPPEQQVLGVLDVDMSLAGMDAKLDRELWKTLGFAVLLFLGVSTFIGLAVIATVNRSVDRLVREVDKVSLGELETVEKVRAADELDKVAQAFNRMSASVARRTRAQDVRYRQLIRNSTDAVVLLDRRGRLLVANPEAARILGLSEDETEGLAASELVEPADLPVLRQALAQALGREGPTEMVSFAVLTRDGRRRVLEGRLRRVEEDDRVTGMLANLRDITERQALEAELDRRRAFEQQLIRQAINAILATDQSGVIQIFNQSAERLLGVPAEEVIGKANYARFFPRAQARLMQRALFEDPQPGSAVVRVGVVKTGDGRRLPVMLSARTLFIYGGYSGAVIFMQSMREAKQLKSQLLKKTRLAAVGQTAAGLAHCLKNLLHGLGSATYLVDQGLADEDLELAGQGWRMMKQNLDQMSALTQDLLSYARDRRPQYQDFNLNQLLAECSAMVAGRAQELGLEVAMEADPACDRVTLDPMGVRRVVLNLLTNSLDALAEAPPGAGPPRVVLADGRDGYGQVWVSVADNGPGLTPEAQRHLFGGLFTTKGSKGTGLGLLVSQKIAEEHHGTLEAVNLKEGGARFVMVVPDLSDAGQSRAAGA